MYHGEDVTKSLFVPPPPIRSRSITKVKEDDNNKEDIKLCFKEKIKNAIKIVIGIKKSF